MQLCSENHQEVAFEGNKCPACALREDMTQEISDMKRQHEDEIQRLKSELDDCNLRHKEELQELFRQLEEAKSNQP